MSLFVAITLTRQDTIKRGQNNYRCLGKNRSTPTRTISKCESKLAIRIEVPMAPVRDTSVLERNTIKNVEKEVVVPNMTLDTQ